MKVTIKSLCEAYEKEYPFVASSDSDDESDPYEDPNYFYVEPRFPEELMKIDSAKLTAVKLHNLRSKVWIGDDSLCDLSNLYRYAFNRGLIPNGQNPAEILQAAYADAVAEEDI